MWCKQYTVGRVIKGHGLALCFLEYLTRDEVHKSSNSECHTPPSEPFEIGYVRYLKASDPEDNPRSNINLRTELLISRNDPARKYAERRGNK
jgi:hypothetical protein